MPNQEFTRNMARYNAWQNESLLDAASALSDAERIKERGAFFGSIEGTFAHLFWGDRIWMSRFAGTKAPKGGIPTSAKPLGTWNEFCAARRDFDQQILQWAQGVSPDWFVGDLTWFSGAVDRNVSKPKHVLIAHFFNHQTHHRGQIHAMITAAGGKPEDTDIPFMPAHYLEL